MDGHVVSLDTLHARYDTLADGSQQGNSRPVYCAIVARLVENRRLAEAQGWTQCALERMRGGRLHLAGVAPGSTTMVQVPDLARGER